MPSGNLVGTVKPPSVAVQPTTSPDTIIKKIFSIIMIIIGIASVGFAIYGGYKMITSAGDTNKFQEGQKTLFYAIIGMIVALVAYPLGNLIMQLFTGQRLPNTVKP